MATATGLFVAIPGFASYYFFRNRIQAVSSYTEEVINNLFRGMPYAYLAGMNIGDDPSLCRNSQGIHGCRRTAGRIRGTAIASGNGCAEMKIRHATRGGTRVSNRTHVRRASRSARLLHLDNRHERAALRPCHRTARGTECDEEGNGALRGPHQCEMGSRKVGRSRRHREQGHY